MDLIACESSLYFALWIQQVSIQKYCKPSSLACFHKTGSSCTRVYFCRCHLSNLRRRLHQHHLLMCAKVSHMEEFYRRHSNGDSGAPLVTLRSKAIKIHPSHSAVLPPSEKLGNSIVLRPLAGRGNRGLISQGFA